MVSQSQKSLGIGNWTSTQAHDTGFKVYDPGTNIWYMYVQYNQGSGSVKAHNGQPVGFYNVGLNASAQGTSNTRSEMIVTTDQSDAYKWAGTIVSNITNTTGVTNNYYGWVQLWQPGTKLINCRLVTASASSDIVAWSADDHLASTTLASVIARYADRLGVVCSTVATTNVGTTNYIGDVLCV